MSEPCGSQRVTETVEGHDYRIAWCPRVDGPCPFPGTREARDSVRKCADSPGHRLYVHYADDVVERARATLRTLLDRLEGSLHPDGEITVSVAATEDLHVAVAAIDACLGTPGDPV